MQGMRTAGQVEKEREFRRRRLARPSGYINPISLDTLRLYTRRREARRLTTTLVHHLVQCKQNNQSGSHHSMLCLARYTRREIPFFLLILVLGDGWVDFQYTVRACVRALRAVSVVYALCHILKGER